MLAPDLPGVGRSDQASRRLGTGRVTQPALVVRGDRDPLATREWAEGLGPAALGRELVALPGAPHGLPCSAPEPFVAAVRHFLRSVAGD